MQKRRKHPGRNFFFFFFLIKNFNLFQASISILPLNTRKPEVTATIFDPNISFKVVWALNKLEINVMLGAIW